MSALGRGEPPIPSHPTGHLSSLPEVGTQTEQETKREVIESLNSP